MTTSLTPPALSCSGNWESEGTSKTTIFMPISLELCILLIRFNNEKRKYSIWWADDNAILKSFKNFGVYLGCCRQKNEFVLNFILAARFIKRFTRSRKFWRKLTQSRVGYIRLNPDDRINKNRRTEFLWP